MNRYKVLKLTLMKRGDEMLKKYAFFPHSIRQFEEGMKKLGLEANQTDQIESLGENGGYILKSKYEEFEALAVKLVTMHETALNDPKTGFQYAYDMFCYELDHSDFKDTGDVGEALRELNLTLEEIEQNPMLKEAFEAAKKSVVFE